MLLWIYPLGYAIGLALGRVVLPQMRVHGLHSQATHLKEQIQGGAHPGEGHILLKQHKLLAGCDAFRIEA